jgi:hypothetical protein
VGRRQLRQGAEVARSYGGALRFGQSGVLGGLKVEAVLPAGLQPDP